MFQDGMYATLLRFYPYVSSQWTDVNAQNYTSALLMQAPVKSNLDAPQLTGEQIMSNLLDTGATVAIRIGMSLVVSSV